MAKDVASELAALRRMGVAELCDKYAEVFGETTATRNRTWLQRRIAWRIQANAEGDLSERARQRAAELVRDADLRVTAPKTPPAVRPVTRGGTRSGTLTKAKSDDRLPPPGSVLTRVYKGETVQVKVLPQGFEYANAVYGSLSAVAKAITGSHCNGYLFFGLTRGGDQ